MHLLAEVQERADLIDVYRRFAELAIEGAYLNAYFTDGMHPNPAGQQIIADMLAETFAEPAKGVART